MSGLSPEDDMEQRRSDILNAAARVQDGAGVVILTDMFGGTPSNLAISVMDGGRIEVICGVNLPMLIKLATMRDGADLDHAVVEAREAGRKYITVASKVLAGKRAGSVPRTTARRRRSTTALCRGTCTS